MEQPDRPPQNLRIAHQLVASGWLENDVAQIGPVPCVLAPRQMQSIAISAKEGKPTAGLGVRIRCSLAGCNAKQQATRVSDGMEIHLF